MKDKRDAKIMKWVTTEVERVLGTKAVFAYVLGSLGTPRFHAQSDIDLAVYWQNPFSKKTLLQAHSALEEALTESQKGSEITGHHALDLVSLNKIDFIYARQVLDSGHLLFCHNKGLLLKWKMRQMSMYPDFKRSRAVIENLILNRKKYV